MNDGTICADDGVEVCTLDNPVFKRFQEIAFRRSTSDGTPIMSMRLGEREAVVPLYALQREFAIADSSPDGQMLDRIVRSLDFVTDLHPGDRFPAEVINGTASWAPAPQHRHTARERLQRGLIAWLEKERGSTASDPETAWKLEENVELRDRINVALRRAAMWLQLPSSENVVTLIEELADELSYIEALRDRLLAPVQAGQTMLTRCSAGFTGDSDRTEVMTRVRRLTAIAASEIAALFAEIDAQTGEILPMLRNAESQRIFIRSHRDGLYRTLRAWEPTLRLWASLELQIGEESWNSVIRSYQFLAQRYMQSQEWIDAQKSRPARSANAIGARMQW